MPARYCKGLDERGGAACCPFDGQRLPFQGQMRLLVEGAAACQLRLSKDFIATSISV